MLIRKTAFICVVFMLALSLGVSAKVTFEFKTEFSCETRTLTVSGKTNTAPTKQAAIVILNPGFSENDVKPDRETVSDKSNSIARAVCFAEQTEIKKDRTFSHIFTLPQDAPFGLYTVRVKVSNADEVCTDVFYYKDLADDINVRNDINAAAAGKADMKSVLDSRIYAVDFEIGKKYFASENVVREYICRGLKGTEYKSLEEIGEKINSCYVKIEALERVKSASKSEMVKVIRENNDTLGMTELLLDDYDGLNEVRKEYVILHFASAVKNITAPDELEPTLKKVIDESKGQNGQGGSSGGGSGGSVKNSVTTQWSAPSQQQPQKSIPEFLDIENVKWAQESIIALAARGILNGKTDKHFDPDSYVTREEYIKMIVAAFDIKGSAIEIPFEDVKKGEWYYPYLIAAYSAEITNGVSENRFGIGENISRQDMAVLLYNAYIKSGHELAVPEEGAGFADADTIKAYAVPSVNAMYAAGIINGMEDGRFAPEEFATRAQAAKMIYSLIRE